MNKEYKYRKHLLEPVKYFGGIFLSVIAFVVLSLIGTYILSDNKNTEEFFIILIGVIIILGLVFGIEVGIFYLLVFKRFKKVKVTLTEGGILYENIKGKTLLNYDKITKIETPQIQYTGGYINIKHNFGSIKLTVVLENIGEFIKELKEELDKRGLSEVYNESKLFNFYKTAVYSDKSWERLYDYVLKYVGFLLVNIVLSILVASIFYIGVGAIFIAIFGSLIGFMVSEFIMGRKLSKTIMPNEFTLISRDKVYEKDIMDKCFIITSIAIILVIILISVI